MIGARDDDDNGDNSGSAYAFVRSGTTWTEQAKLTASDGAAGDEFGYSIVISGDTVVVGADYDDDNGDNSGSAYIFERSGTTWTEELKLTASDGAAGDEFGTSVAFSGDMVVIGSYFDDDAGVESGSAYVYLLEDSEAPPETVIQDVMDDIEGMELPEGTENSLISILQNAISSLEKENYNAAMNKINAFINEVEAQSGKKITEEEAEYLILVGQIINEAILENQ